jgi:glucose dehydrogenase
MGTSDKIIRIIVGLALFIFGLVTAPQGGSFIIGLIGVVLVVTALISFCPLYQLLGISTGCKTEK